jgi:hypothetical protein
MRIKGPSGGPPPLDEISGAAGTGRAEPLGSVDRTAATGGAQAVSATQSARPGDAVAEVARRLRAGEISPREAVELLIDDAVNRQVGRVTADRQALATELKDLLRRYTETDPYLASKVRRLGNKT